MLNKLFNSGEGVTYHELASKSPGEHNDAMNNISDTMPESRPGEDDVPIDARAIIRDFLKLPYAISGSLECVVVVDDWKTVDMVIPTQILGAVALGGKTKNQIFGTPILDEWRVRRKFIRDGEGD